MPDLPTVTTIERTALWGAIERWCDLRHALASATSRPAVAVEIQLFELEKHIEQVIAEIEQAAVNAALTSTQRDFPT